MTGTCGPRLASGHGAVMLIVFTRFSIFLSAWVTDSLLLIACWNVFVSPVATETEYSFDEILFHVWCALCTHIISQSNFQPWKVAAEYFDSGIFVCAHLESFFNRNMLSNMYFDVPIYEKKIFLPTHDCRVVTRIEKGEDCVLRISDEIRTNTETLHVAVSTLMC